MNKSYLKGQSLASVLPSIELLEKSRELAEEAMVEIGRLALETVLAMSAIEIAGEPRKGMKKGEVRHHGSQLGRVVVGGRRVQIDKPRLRTKDGSEVRLPTHLSVARWPLTNHRGKGN